MHRLQATKIGQNPDSFTLMAHCAVRMVPIVIRLKQTRNSSCRTFAWQEGIGSHRSGGIAALHLIVFSNRSQSYRRTRDWRLIDRYDA